MSTISPLDSVANAARTTRSASTIGMFFREVWASFRRHSEMQMMLSSGYAVATLPSRASNDKRA